MGKQTILYEGFKLKNKYAYVEDLYGRVEEIYTLCFTKPLQSGFGLNTEISIPAVKLFEELKELPKTNRSKKENIYLGYYITSTPLSWQDCESKYAAIVLGIDNLKADVVHRYSDLTGYLWTDETLAYVGHDLLKELSSEENNYVTLMFTC